MIIVSSLISFHPISSFLICLSLVDQDQTTRQNKTHIFGIITGIDLLEFIVKHDKSGETNSGETIKQNGCHQEAKDESIVAKQSEALH